LVHDTKTGINVPNEHKIYQMVNIHKIFQMTMKYITIFRSQALQNLPKSVFFGLKTNHLATLIMTSRNLVVLFY
jgi:hypothetical protein